MGSYGRHNKKIRKAYFNRDFKAWQDAMIDRGSIIVAGEQMFPPWEDKIDGPIIWDNTYGMYLEDTNYVSDGTNKEIKEIIDMNKTVFSRTVGRNHIGINGALLGAIKMDPPVVLAVTRTTTDTDDTTDVFVQLELENKNEDIVITSVKKRG